MIVGIGFDLVDIARVKRLIASKGDRALQRLFTDEEVRYAQSKTTPAVHLAARIAAKEAAFKALSGTDDAKAIGWRDSEVVLDAHGRPSLRLHGRATRRASELGVTGIFLTLSHSESVAGAVVIMERD